MAKRKQPMSVKVVSHADVLLGVVDKALKRKVSAMGHTVRDKLLTEVLVGERGGRWYQVPGTKRMYRASSPGEPPASRTGDLRRSYKVGPVEGQSPHFSVKVGSELPYARYLETNLNRKHLEPAVKLAEPELLQIVQGDWEV